VIYQGDVFDKLQEIESDSIQCVVTSPPYWGLRNYQMDDQLGLEETPEEYVENMVKVFREVKRVLKDDGTLWLNLGDSYNSQTGSGFNTNQNEGQNHRITDLQKMQGSLVKKIGLKPKNLVGIPWRVAFALQADGWYLRQDIIWHKPNPMPESVTDRCTKSHEYIFLLTKSAQYFYDADAIREPAQDWGTRDRSQFRDGTQDELLKHRGLKDANFANIGRNKRSVWTINTKPYKEAHFAVFPPKLPELCIKAGSSEGDVVLDPFFGSGTTGWVAQRLGRKWIGIELNPEYIKIAEKRFNQRELFIECQ
jgi:DNA modification methylase